MSSMERTVISGALANAADERPVLAGPGGIADRGDAGSGIAVQCDGIPPPKVTSGAAAGPLNSAMMATLARAGEYRGSPHLAIAARNRQPGR